jgi:hypothetical protein
MVSVSALVKTGLINAWYLVGNVAFDLRHDGHAGGD